MIYIKTKYIIYNILLILPFFGYSQQLPPIVKYAPSTYTGGNQNWMISQDKNQFMFFANNDGLLEFNGSSWNLYSSPNETIIRSVKVVGDKVFTGCYMEFGFWTREANKKLKYTSLSKKIKNKIIDDEQFWNILNYEQWVIFQSLNQIYIYDTKTEKFNIINSKNGILKSFKVDNSIYFQVDKDGLFEIENGKQKLFSNNIILKNNKIVNIYATNDGLMLQTQYQGLYKLVSGKLTKFTTDVDAEIASSSVYSSE